MARLPQPGSDSGKWGDILNQYLLEAHTPTGGLKSGTVQSSTVANDAITAQKLSPALRQELAAKYVKPAGGIAEADLSNDLQTRLAAATTTATTSFDVLPPSGTADATDAIRAALSRLGGKPGIVRLAPGNYYIGGGTTPAGAAFVLASGQRIEGAGHDRGSNFRTVLWVDDNTKQSSHLVNSVGTTGIAVTGLTFENRGTIATVDRGRDPVYLRRCSNFELSYNTATTTNVGFQFDLNIKSTDASTADQWGTDGWVHDCRFLALTEFHQTHNLRVERCHWQIDRSLGRPAWLRGANQTGFKFSGSWGLLKGCKLLDCSMHVVGTGERVEPFEIVRATETIVQGFMYSGDRPNAPALVQMNTSKPEHGVIEGQLKTVFRDCEFGNMNIVTLENVALSFYGCRWTNTAGGPFNALNDGYNPASKQAVTVWPNEFNLTDCEFRGGGRYFVGSNANQASYRLTNCIIDFDNTIFARALEISGDKTIILDNCRINLQTISAGSPSAVTLNNVTRSYIRGQQITFGPGVATTTAPIYVMGTGTVSLGDFILPPQLTTKVTKSGFTGTITGE